MGTEGQSLVVSKFSMGMVGQSLAVRKFDHGNGRTEFRGEEI